MKTYGTYIGIWLALALALALGLRAAFAVDEFVPHDVTTPFVLSTWGMLWAGQIFHLFNLLVKLEDVSSGTSAWAWLRRHPFTVLREIVAGFIAYTLLASWPGQLTVASAFAAGYMASDFASKAATRTETKIPDPDNKDPQG